MDAPPDEDHYRLGYARGGQYRIQLFLASLAIVEVASVRAAHVDHEAAALILTALSVLVLLGSRRQPLAASVAAFAALTVSTAVMPRATVAQFFGTLVTFAVAGAVNREREAVVAWLAGAGMLGYTARRSAMNALDWRSPRSARRSHASYTMS